MDTAKLARKHYKALAYRLHLNKQLERRKKKKAETFIKKSHRSQFYQNRKSNGKVNKERHSLRWMPLFQMCT